jgi:hypothetical protein
MFRPLTWPPHRCPRNEAVAWLIGASRSDPSPQLQVAPDRQVYLGLIPRVFAAQLSSSSKPAGYLKDLKPGRLLLRNYTQVPLPNQPHSCRSLRSKSLAG